MWQNNFPYTRVAHVDIYDRCLKKEYLNKLDYEKNGHQRKKLTKIHSEILFASSLHKIAESPLSFECNRLLLNPYNHHENLQHS